MTTQADKVLPDHVPANHTFSAAGVIDGLARWYEKTTNSLVAGWYALTISTKINPDGKSPMRFQYKLVVPTTVTETINGVAYVKVARQILINVEVLCAADSTANERSDAMCFLGADAGGVNTAQFFGNIVKNADVIV